MGDIITKHLPFHVLIMTAKVLKAYIYKSEKQEENWS